MDLFLEDMVGFVLFNLGQFKGKILVCATTFCCFVLKGCGLMLQYAWFVMGGVKNPF